MINIGSISSNDAARQSSSLENKKEADKKVQVTASIPAVDRISEKLEKQQPRRKSKNVPDEDRQESKVVSSDVSTGENDGEETYDRQGKKGRGKRIDFTV